MTAIGDHSQGRECIRFSQRLIKCVVILVVGDEALIFDDALVEFHSGVIFGPEGLGGLDSVVREEDVDFVFLVSDSFVGDGGHGEKVAGFFNGEDANTDGRNEGRRWR